MQENLDKVSQVKFVDVGMGVLGGGGCFDGGRSWLFLSDFA